MHHARPASTLPFAPTPPGLLKQAAARPAPLAWHRARHQGARRCVMRRGGRRQARLVGGGERIALVRAALDQQVFPQTQHLRVGRRREASDVSFSASLACTASGRPKRGSRAVARAGLPPEDGGLPMPCAHARSMRSAHGRHSPGCDAPTIICCPAARMEGCAQLSRACTNSTAPPCGVRARDSRSERNSSTAKRHTGGGQGAAGMGTRRCGAGRAMQTQPHRRPLRARLLGAPGTRDACLGEPGALEVCCGPPRCASAPRAHLWRSAAAPAPPPGSPPPAARGRRPAPAARRCRSRRRRWARRQRACRPGAPLCRGWSGSRCGLCPSQRRHSGPAAQPKRRRGGFLSRPAVRHPMQRRGILRSCGEEAAACHHAGSPWQCSPPPGLASFTLPSTSTPVASCNCSFTLRFRKRPSWDRLRFMAALLRLPARRRWQALERGRHKAARVSCAGKG